MEVAVFQAVPDKIALSHFNDTIGVRITLSRGAWAVFGRVVIRNFDSDDQPANAQLRARDGSHIMDRIDVRIPSIGDGFSETFPLQGVLRVGETDIVDVTAATFKGEAQQFSLIAMKVDTLSEGKG